MSQIFVDQAGFEHAREIQEAFLDELVRLETADFARIEVAGVLRKKGLLAGRLTALDQGIPLLTTDAEHAIEGVVKTELLRGVGES